MHMRTSTVLKKLRKGEIVNCFKMNLTDGRAVEIAAMCGYDCLWLGMEHVPNDWSVIESQIWAAKAHNTDTMVRISRGGYSDYIKPLELDASGIMVPHVMSLEDAEYVVRTTRFQPMGRRPVDGGNADGAYCMMDFNQYIQEANRERFVVVQIEDPEPLDELEEIAKLEGIDMLFFRAGRLQPQHRRTRPTGPPGGGGRAQTGRGRRGKARQVRRNNRKHRPGGLETPCRAGIQLPQYRRGHYRHHRVRQTGARFVQGDDEKIEVRSQKSEDRREKRNRNRRTGAVSVIPAVSGGNPEVFCFSLFLNTYIKISFGNREPGRGGFSPPPADLQGHCRGIRTSCDRKNSDTGHFSKNRGGFRRQGVRIPFIHAHIGTTVRHIRIDPGKCQVLAFTAR